MFNIYKRRITSILLIAFFLLTLTVFSGCEILNSRVLQEGVFIEEEEEEPQPAAVAPAEPEEEGPSPWELHFATWPITFGFANDEGSKLIHVFYDYSDPDAVLPEPSAETGDEASAEANEDYDEDYEPNNYFEETGFDPDMFSLAVGPYGEIWPISFAFWQEERRANNGRENAYNFENLPGFVYAQKDWKLTKNRTYLLTQMGPILDSIIAIAPSGWSGNTPPMSEETTESIEKYKERKIEWTKTLAVTKVGEGQIGLVLYERQGNDMLFSIVYTDETKTLFWDNPAVYDETSTWRTDAGDEPGSFSPLLLASFDEGLMLVLLWSAPEGEIAVILYEEDGVFVHAEDLFFARYTA